MLRGIILGTVSGLALATAGLSTVSLLALQPAGNRPPDAPQSVLPAITAAQSPDAATPDSAAPSPPPDAAATPPTVSAPDQGAGPVTDTSTAPLPATPTDAPALIAPETGNAPHVAVPSDSPVLPNPQAAAPALPQAEADLVLSTTPAIPTPDPDPVVIIADPAPEPGPGLVIIMLGAPEGAIPALVSDTPPDPSVVTPTLPSVPAGDAPGAPPEGAPPDSAPPDGAPPEGAPPDAAPPEDPSPEGAPPDGAPRTATADAAPAPVAPALVPELAPLVDPDAGPVAPDDAAAAEQVIMVPAEPAPTDPPADEAASDPVDSGAESAMPAPPPTGLWSQTDAPPRPDAEEVAPVRPEPAPPEPAPPEPAPPEPAPPEPAPPEPAAPEPAPPGRALTAAAPDDAPDPTEVAVETADAPVAASDPVTPPGRLTLQGDGPGLPAATDGVRINRPGAEPAAEPESAVEPAAAADPAPALTPSGPALILHAAPFDNPAALAELAIILIDAGDMAGAAAAVAAIGFPVTIAIDPGRPGAAADMAVYRAQGREVMMLARLPIGARPVDVAVVFEAAFATLPETVAVLDAGDGGLTARSAITQQALTRLAQDGRGLVVMGGGLNGIDRDAAQVGVPAATVLRDLDGEGQDARVIRRFLDDAAFRARQQGQAIILGRVRPDTLSALLLWGAADRAGQVALAPVSALLQAAAQ